MLLLRLLVHKVVKVDELKLRAVARAPEASVAGVHRVAEVDSGSEDNVTVVVVCLLMSHIPVVVHSVGIVRSVVDNLVVDCLLLDVGGLMMRSHLWPVWF